MHWAPLAKSYKQDPLQAMITDSASSHCKQANMFDPLHGKVTAGGYVIPIAVHSAVGGDSDGPVPGDLLCAALASCVDSTIRIVANRLGLVLNSVDVRVTGEVDVRGTLCLQPEIPVGFQTMHLSVLLNATLGSNQKLIAALFQATFLLNHFELFGLSQTFNPMQGKAEPVKHFRTLSLYKIVRHPIQTGVLIGMWAVPVSTMSHLFFAASMTLYIFVGLYFEEKDLIREFGSTYRDYMVRVKRLIPFIS